MPCNEIVKPLWIRKCKTRSVTKERWENQRFWTKMACHWYHSNWIDRKRGEKEPEMSRRVLAKIKCGLLSLYLSLSPCPQVLWPESKSWRSLPSLHCDLLLWSNNWSITLKGRLAKRRLVSINMIHSTWHKEKKTCKKTACTVYIRVFHENMFLKKKYGSTRSASIGGWVWRNPKGFLIYRGCTSHFRFDHFYM